MARRRRPTRRGFGAVRVLPSGRIQASYIGPDTRRHTAPHTFEAHIDAEGWLATERRLMVADTWTPPKERQRARWRGLTLADYAPGAVDRRRVRGEPLKPRTRALYLGILERVILPDLGDRPLHLLTPEEIADWYDSLDPSKPTQRAHAYSLLRTVLNQALTERVIVENPCHVRGAGRTSRARDIQIATPEELVAIAAAMPDHLRLLILLAAWCGLRYGELAELRRRDIDLDRGVIVVARAVVRVDGQDIIGPPKSHAGVRTVAVPPHVRPTTIGTSTLR